MDGQPGFFDLDHRYEQLSKSGDPLERLSEVVNFEAFRYRLVKALRRSGSGSPPLAIPPPNPAPVPLGRPARGVLGVSG